MLASACPWPLTAMPKLVGDVLERAVAPVAPEGIGLGIVGDEEVDPAVAVEVGRQDAHAAARARHARRGRDVGERPSPSLR